MANSQNRIVLAFSGGLDTSAIIPWLRENYKAEVIAYCSDLGNAPDGVELEKWAKKLGAVDFVFEDLKEDFARRFAFPAVRAGATYQDDYLLGTALGRPLIAERVAFFAKKFGATGIAHGATGKGNDQLRFEKAWAYLCPEVQVIAPWKIWSYTGRKELLAYLKERGLELHSKEKLYSVDVNLFHRSCEGGILESPGKEYAPEQIYEWVKSPEKLTQDMYTVKVAFEKGVPVSLNDKKLSPAKLLTELNQLAGQAGVGVLDLVEERANGIKSRGVYETPGGTVLHLATKNLKHLCWDRSLQSLARYMGGQYGELVYDGNWFSEARSSIEGFFDKACQTLTGQVTLKLHQGQARVTQRESPFALYDEKTVSFEEDPYELLKNAQGFSKTVSFKHWLAGKRNQRTGQTIE